MAIGIHAPYLKVSFSAFPKPRQKRFLGEKLDQKVVQQRGLEIIKAIITVLMQNACSSHKNMNSELIFNRENQSKSSGYYASIGLMVPLSTCLLMHFLPEIQEPSVPRQQARRIRGS